LLEALLQKQENNIFRRENRYLFVKHFSNYLVS